MTEAGIAAGIRNVMEMAQRLDCVSNLDNIFHNCSSIITDKCLATSASATKVIRLSMETVSHMLRKNPNLKVIHLLRDPRGVAHSRSKIGLMSRLGRPREISKMVTEAEIICKKMQNDIDVRKNLEKLHSNNFLEVIYEDVAANQYSNYERIYKFLNLEPSSTVERWINSSNTVKANVNRENAFGTFRANSTETAYKWKDDVDETTLDNLTAVCNGVLKYLGAL